MTDEEIIKATLENEMVRGTLDDYTINFSGVRQGPGYDHVWEQLEAFARDTVILLLTVEMPAAPSKKKNGAFNAWRDEYARKFLEEKGGSERIDTCSEAFLQRNPGAKFSQMAGYMFAKLSAHTAMVAMCVQNGIDPEILKIFDSAN